VDSSTIPSSITDLRTFSPMMEMAHGFVWRLTCDVVLAAGSQDAQTALEEHLASSEIAITSSSYLGALIPGRWCPTFAYHFKVASYWPTRPSPIKELAKLPLVSERGQDYDPLTIDLYIPVHPPLALVTRIRKLSMRIASGHQSTLILVSGSPPRNHQLSSRHKYQLGSHHRHNHVIHQLKASTSIIGPQST
jgi:hypothetical protein